MEGRIIFAAQRLRSTNGSKATRKKPRALYPKRYKPPSLNERQ